MSKLNRFALLIAGLYLGLPWEKETVTVYEGEFGRTKRSGWQTVHSFDGVTDATVKLLENEKTRDELRYEHYRNVYEIRLVVPEGEIVLRTIRTGYQPMSTCQYSDDRHNMQLEVVTIPENYEGYRKDTNWVKDGY
jgi:hypothetical protein